MPLSEDEQRILSEIEKNFYKDDPSFARGVENLGLAKAARNSRLSVLTFVIGLIVLIVQFTSHVIIGFVGFLIMVASAVVFERNFRRLGRDGWEQLKYSIGARQGNGYVSNARRHLKSRNESDEP